MIMFTFPNLALSVMYLRSLNDTKCTLFLFKKMICWQTSTEQCAFFLFSSILSFSYEITFCYTQIVLQSFVKNTMFEFIATVQKEKHFNSKHFLNKVGHFKKLRFFSYFTIKRDSFEEFYLHSVKKWSFLDYLKHFLSLQSVFTQIKTTEIQYLPRPENNTFSYVNMPLSYITWLSLSLQNSACADKGWKLKPDSALRCVTNTASQSDCIVWDGQVWKGC